MGEWGELCEWDALNKWGELVESGELGERANEMNLVNGRNGHDNSHLW